jgi:peptidoglycan/LPS O-acetylase OafA/YrhL
MRPTADSPNLDLLRSLAVTYVVVLHLLLFFRGKHVGIWGAIGFWGVLLFFVHTSLVLMFSLERQKTRSPEANIFALFYVRRCFRILPLCMLVVAAIAVFRWPVAYGLAGRFYPAHLSALGYVSNLLLFQNLTHTGSITAPLWSLPYEMQMYVIFPVLYLIICAVRSVRPVAVLWFATAGAAWISLSVIQRGFPSSIALAPCFMAGIVSYKLGQVTTTRPAFIGWPVMILLTVYLYWLQPTAQRGWLSCLVVGLPLVPSLMAGVMPYISRESGARKLPFIGWPIMLLLVTYLYLREPTPQRGWVWCLVVGVSVPYFAEMTHNWLRKVCHLIARYSYGVYLVHVICIWLAFVELAELPLAVRWLVFVIIVALFPIILYHSVEAPMISLGRRITDRMAVQAERAPQLVPAAGINSGEEDLSDSLVISRNH